MAATDARPVPKKNVAFRHYFAIRKNDGTLITTWAGQDSELSQDGGNYSDATNEATEIQTSGTGYIDLTAGEMNYDCVILKVTVTNTDALDYVVIFFPEEAGDIRTDVTQVGGDTQSATDLKDFANAGYDPATNKVQGVVLTDTCTTLTGHTAQTGDTYALANGATGFAAIDTVVDAILLDTAVIGAAGAGLTAIPWNAAWDAEVQSECTDALNAYDPPTNAEMVARTLLAADYFDPATDTVVNVTNVATLTGHTAQTGDTFALANGAAGFVAIDTVVDAIKAETTLIVADTAELQTDDVPGLIAALNDFNPASDKVYLGNGAHGGAAAAITLADYSDFQGAAGDPWATALPGAYGAGTAGFIVGTNLDAILSARTLASADYFDPAADTVVNVTNVATLTGHTVQTGDTYALANGATGFAAIDTVVDAIKAETALIVADTGELQTNQGNWVTAVGFSTHSAADVWAVGARTLTANTNLNDPTAATIADAVWDEAAAGHTDAGKAGQQLWTDLDAVLADTGELQTNQGNWVTAVGFSTHSAADVWTAGSRTLTASTNFNDLSAAEVQSEVDTALATIHLDHLLAADYDPASKPGVATALLNELIGNDSGVSQFTANALELGPSGGDDAATIWTYGTRVLTAGTNLNDLSAADVAGELATYDGPTNAEMVAAFTEIKGATWASGTDTLEAIRDRGDAEWITATGFSTHSAADVRTEMDSNSTQLAAIVQDTDELQTDDVPGLIAALNDISTADVATELSTYDGPTKAEMDSAFTEIKGATWASGTDTLEAIRDRGDAAWITSTLTAADVRTEMDSNSTQLAAIVADTAELQTDDVPGLIAALNDISAADVNIQCDTALSDIHLDHLLAANYDPAAKPGVATALLNELIGNDSGVSQFTANALELGPSGGDDAATIWTYGTRVLTANTNLNDPTAAAIRTEMDSNSTQLADIVADTNELQTDDVPGLIAALNDVSTANLASALTDIHLDHLLAVDYDPASKPGVATALLNELVENDGGVSRYTANALEQGPSAGTNPNVLEDTTIAVVNTQTSFTLTAGSDVDDAYNGQAIVMYDASNSDFPSVRVVSDYTGSTKTVTLDSAPDFTILAGDGVKIFVTAPGTSAPTAAENRIEMDANSTKLADIVADTNELQSDDVPGLIAALNDFNPATDTVVNVTNVATLTGHTVQTGDTYALANGASGFVATKSQVDATLVIAEQIVQDTGTDGVVVAAASKSGYSLAADQGTVTIGTVTTLTGHTPQTGDTYALAAGASGFAAIKAETADIVVDTNELQSDDVPGLIAALNDLSAANVATELATYDGPTNAEMVAAFTEIKGATWASGTDTLEAIRDQGDLAWITATSVTVSDKTGFKLASDGLDLVTAWTVDITGSLSGSVGSVTGHTPQTGDTYALAAGASGFAAIKAETVLILADTSELQTDDIPTLIAALPTAIENADALLIRAASNIEDTADKHSLGAMIMVSTNSSVSGTTLTAKKPSDDSTFQTYTLTVNAAADPVTGIS